MTTGTLLLRALRFHWRAHLGTLLGATLATAILAGALAVGDSVRYSLREMALARLGGVHLALIGQSRFFRVEIAQNMASELNAPVAPIALLRGTASGPSREGQASDTRANRVQVLGVEEAFWSLSRGKNPMASSTSAESVVLNDRLAHQLRVQVGEEVILRVDKPSLLSRDAPLSTVEDSSVTLRLPVAAIVGDAEFGRFSLDANQLVSYNAFVPLPTLQKAIGMEGRANTLLVGKGASKEVTSSDATQSLWKHWQLTDAGLELRELPERGALELRTERVFLDPPIGEAALQAYPKRQGVLTYFVNELRVGDRTTPYSTVTAMEGGPVPADLRDDEVLINEWLAQDLQAKPGDTLKLTYWLVGPMRRLEEHASTFRIRAVLPLTGDAADPGLMPDIPGLADKKDCRDWEPGVPIDLQKIRDKDQEYWSAHRGTPKAFLTLRTGQKIWNNRFGNLTAVRYPMQGTTRAAMDACIRQALSPAALGLFFAPVREQALAASGQSLDFGQLFLGFSFFLIVAALLLTALLFAFGVEQRAEEIGLLLAVGFLPKRVRNLLLLEGAALALVAGILGAGLAALYTRAVIRGLSTVWSGAVAGSALQYHAEPKTLFSGAMMGFLVSLLAIWFVARKQAQAPARELLASGAESDTRLFAASKKRTRRALPPGLPTALVTLTGALALVGLAMSGSSESAAGYFFGAGGLLLIGGLALCRMLLSRWEAGASTTGLTVGSLGARGAARRLGRSLSAVALLACGSFLVVSIGANRHDPNEQAGKRASGTGGFALYGESSLPVYQDLNTSEGREAFGLETEELQDVSILALRLREGDDASCLNLNRAQVPRLVGVSPEALQKRGAFVFAQTRAQDAGKAPWTLLDQPEPDGAIPVIGDVNTITWSLGLSPGKTLAYADERGNTRRLRVVGVLANSILQGGLILSESRFTELFPSQSGYQVFLVDAPLGKIESLSSALTRALEPVGLSLTPATERMAAFSAVENTYLSIFAVLGGLGLLLGSFGLGVIVLRNVLERRGELALLRAVGFTQGTLRRLVFAEHALLLSLGLGVGVLSALVAVLPALRAPGAEVPYLSLTTTLLAVLVSGVLWTWGATSLALRGPLLNALRNE